jgi:hypothetical protein
MAPSKNLPNRYNPLRELFRHEIFQIIIKMFSFTAEMRPTQYRFVGWVMICDDS